MQSAAGAKLREILVNGDAKVNFCTEKLHDRRRWQRAPNRYRSLPEGR